jgi:phosphoglucosamine mutase
MVSSPMRTSSSSLSSLAGQSTPTSEPSPAVWRPIALPDTTIFGTDGIRGKAGEFLSAPLALQVGYWAGQVLRSAAATPGPIILGQDSRNSSNMLALALSAGLTAAGLDVWDLGLCPTPAVAHLASVTGAVGGVMISASHNPPEDNGIKFFNPDGSKLLPARQQQIEAALRGQGSGLVTPTGNHWGQHEQRSELLENYVTALQKPLTQQTERPFAGMKVVLDLAWGAATRLAATVFQALGAELVCLHDRPDGNQINVNCGSTHLALLQAAVLAHQADVGFAFDGDADRVLAVDCQGRMVDGDYILYLWGQQLLQAGKLPGNTIVATVMSNLGFENAWKQLGGKLIRANVGDQYVMAEMLKHGALLGGEQSGHILCYHYGISGDGLQTALHVTSLMQQARCSLTDLVNQSFQTYPQLLKNVRVEDRSRRLNWQDCEPLRTAIAQAEQAMGDQGRVLVRASGTEPVIRVMVEAVNADLAHHWTDHLVQTVQAHLA